MAMEKTKCQGIYYRESTTKRYKGKPDGCFYFTYRLPGERQVIWEKAGWKSDGMSASLALDDKKKFLEKLSPNDNAESVAKKKKAALLTYSAGWEIYQDKKLPMLRSTRNIQSRYDVHIAEVFGDKRIANITKLDLDDFIEILFRKGLSAQSVCLILGDMRTVINTLKGWELILCDNPLEKISFPKRDNERTRFLSPEEAQKLLMALKQRSVKWYRIAALSLNTGARLDEILGLKIKNVNLEAGTMLVKGKTGRRNCVLNTISKQILEDAIAQSDQILLFPTMQHNDKVIFKLAQSTGLTPTEVRRLHLGDIDVISWKINYACANNTVKSATISAEYIPVFQEILSNIDQGLVFTSIYGKKNRQPQHCDL